MAHAPGIGPKLQLEQEWALEVTRRMAYNASRDELATMIRKLHYDNMVLRQAIVELIGGED